MTGRALAAEADAQAERKRHEIEEQMDAIRPEPDCLEPRLRDGSFFHAPADAPCDPLPPR